MAVDISELAPIQPLLDELVQAREHTDQFGKWRGSHDSLEDCQNSINYKLATQAETGVVNKVVDGINSADETVLDEFQKAITVKVVAHKWRTPMDKSIGLISDGFRVFERVKEGAEQNRGMIAILGEKSISLFNSNGAQDLQLQPISYERGHKSIVYTLSDGYSVGVESLTDKSFPDPAIHETSFSETGLLGGHGDRVAEQLSVLDPTSDRYKLPFVRLGTPEHPQASIDNHIKTDEERFAARLLAITMGVSGWIQATAPSEELKARVIGEFSNVYTDLLVGDTARDAVEHIGARHSRMTARTDITHSRLRKTSLATYDHTARSRVFYAADINAEEVEAATREKVAKVVEATSPAGVIKAIRAKQFLDV